MKSLIENCRLLISKGKTEDAINELMGEFKKRKTSSYNEILILSSQLSTINRQSSLGLTYNIKDLSRINWAILKILDELEKHDNLSKGFIQSITKENSENKAQYKEDAIDKERLEFLKNQIVEISLNYAIEITKIRAAIEFAYIVFELSLTKELGLNIFKRKDEIIKNLLFDFNKADLFAYSIKWDDNTITIHLHHKNFIKIN